jgi:uncharacterized tellurite resistance protein B-like protein
LRVAASVWLVLAGGSFAPRAVASDITTTAGVKYEQATVTGVDVDGLRITYRFGVVKIPFEKLPSGLRTKYHFDPANVAEYRRQLAAQSAANSNTRQFPQRSSPAGQMPVLPHITPFATPFVRSESKHETQQIAPKGTPISQKRGLQSGRSQSLDSSNTAKNDSNFLLPAAVGLIILVWAIRKAEKSKARSSVVGRSTKFVQPQIRRADTIQSSVPLHIRETTETSSLQSHPFVWRKPGESISHRGIVIRDGMVYTSQLVPQWPGEPSAIILSLPVAEAAASTTEDFGYWPSYDRIGPEQRRCYLEWLAQGRRDSDPSLRSLGYLFIFFYGLERRIVCDKDRDPVLLNEVVGLLEHYGPAHRSRSLRSYLSQLVHYGGWQLGCEDYRLLWPRLMTDEDRPDEDGLRFVLGNLFQREEPMDWTVAYRLAVNDHSSRRSIVVRRAQAEFFALFQQRFGEKFPNGLKLQATPQPTVIRYRPASNTLAQLAYQQQTLFILQMPNVIGLRRQFESLPEIWNSCVEDLSGYSRVLASKRVGDAAALAAWQALPNELRKAEDHPRKQSFEQLIAAAPHEGDYTFVPTGSLAVLGGVSERPKLTLAQSKDIADLVTDLGWRLAPDPQITGLPLAWNQELALYRAAPEEYIADDLMGVVRLLYLAMTICAADGAVESKELEAFHQIAAARLKTEDDLRTLRATEASLRRDANVPLRCLPQITSMIAAENRQLVLRTLAHIAAADAEVSLHELKILRRIARAFALDADVMERLLREDETFREVTIVTKTGVRRGEPIPRRSQATTAFALNEEKIKALTEETREVISLLSVVMAEPGETVSAPIEPASSVPQKSVEWLNGLPERYQSAVVKLIQFDEVTSQDFDRIAAEAHLTPEDLLNGVNAWSDEALGDFLFERKDNVRVFRNLLPDAAVVAVAA